ncbi:MAG: hypothetical protein FWE88_07485 [Phycisphaerae bacterium]|nr:hypothetical protein [Phycisphaerae bacterium]
MTRRAMALWAGLAAAAWLGVWGASVVADTAATRPASTQPASASASMPTPEEMKSYRWIKLSKPPDFSPVQHGFDSVSVRDGVMLINKHGGRGMLDLTVDATSQPAEAAATTSRPASLSQAALVQLLADLGDSDWERAERAAMELSHYDRQAEAALEDALLGVVNDAFQKRAAAVLERIYAARVKITGVWQEELWANVKHKQLVRITADAKGTITLSPAPGARYQHYKYSEASFDGTTLKFHVQTNPDYEFDVELKLDDNGELAGTRTQRGSGKSWDFRMTRVREF